MTRRRPLVSLVRVVALVAAAACSSPGMSSPDYGQIGAPVNCPSDLPASCPTPIPSWATDVEPIVTQRCAICHESGGLEVAPFELTSYQDVLTNRSAVLDQVYGCYMPPEGNPVGAEAPLSADERAALLAWLVCGAPRN